MRQIYVSHCILNEYTVYKVFTNLIQYKRHSVFYFALSSIRSQNINNIVLL